MISNYSHQKSTKNAKFRQKLSFPVHSSPSSGKNATIFRAQIHFFLSSSLESGNQFSPNKINRDSRIFFPTQE